VNQIRRFAALSTLSAMLLTGVAFAQGDRPGDAHHQAYVRHDEWKKGAKINQNDWGRGEAVDYKTYHLQAPRKGYEWREVDGNYVLAAVATGVIASTIVAAAAH
jgi:Ni/Co efflux regulator RcnB